jgi:hypothetical protein
VLIHGVIGRTASLLNGKYSVYSEPSLKSANQKLFFRYFKQDLNKPRKIFMEYMSDLKRWQFKPEKGLGIDLCWAYIESKVLLLTVCLFAFSKLL